MLKACEKNNIARIAKSNYREGMKEKNLHETNFADIDILIIYAPKYLSV